MKKLLLIVFLIMLTACSSLKKNTSVLDKMEDGSAQLVSGETWGATRTKINDTDSRVTILESEIDTKQDASTAATDEELAAGLALKQDASTAATDSELASAVAIDASGFDGNLTTSDDTIQELAQAVDDLAATSTITPDGTDPTKAAVAVLADTATEATHATSADTATSASTVPGSGITGTVDESVIDSDIARDSEVTSAVSTKQDTITSSTDLTIKDLTADSVTTNFTDGLAGSFWNNYNTSTPTLTGKMGIWPESDGIHFSNDGTDGGVLGTGSAIDITVADMADSAVETSSEGLTNTNTAFPTSATVYAEIQTLTALVNALQTAVENAGINAFTFLVSDPSSFPDYVSATSYTWDMTVADISSISDTDTVKWQVNSGGYESNDCTYVTDHWECAIAGLTENSSNTVQFQACDDQTTPSCGESSEYTQISDTSAPVGVADADSTHSGAEDSITSGIDWTETYLDASTITCTVVNATPTSPEVTCVGNACDTEALTPDGTGTVTCTWVGKDYAENEATGTDLVQEFTYSGSADQTPYDVQFYEGATETVNGTYKLLLSDSSGDVVAISNPITYSNANGYVTATLATVNGDVVSASTYYASIVMDDIASSYVRFMYPTTASTWGMDNDGGTYATPATSMSNGTCAGDNALQSSPMMRIRNSSGTVLVEWGGTISGETALGTRNTTLTWCDGAVAN